MQKKCVWWVLSNSNWATHLSIFDHSSWSKEFFMILVTRHVNHFECGVLFLFFCSSWSAISLRARSVTKILKDFLFLFFHCRNWFKRFFRSSISWKMVVISILKWSNLPQLSIHPLWIYSSHIVSGRNIKMLEVFPPWGIM